MYIYVNFPFTSWHPCIFVLYILFIWIEGRINICERSDCFKYAAWMFLFFNLSRKHLEGCTHDFSMFSCHHWGYCCIWWEKSREIDKHFVIFISIFMLVGNSRGWNISHKHTLLAVLIQFWRSNAGTPRAALSIKETFPLSAFSICQGSESEDAPVSPSPHRWITTLCFLSGHDLLLGNPGSQLYEESGASFFIY